MPKKQKPLDRFVNLTWDDLELWAGDRIVSRGRSYQQQGRVSELAITKDGGLVAWVDGSERYAARVIIDKDGLPDSICTCPYEFDCKHGVAIVLEYLKRIEKNQHFDEAKKDDERLSLLEDETRDDDEVYEDENTLSADRREEIDAFLKGKTKAQLIELIYDLAEQYPQISLDLVDRRQISNGDTKSLVKRLSREIRDIGDEPGWQNYWQNEGYTPDYSGIRTKLEALLKSGYADDVLTLGKELIEVGTLQVEESHDEGETAMEIESCMPVVVTALEQSSIDTSDKLTWAVEAILKDQYGLCETFAEYLYRMHPKSAWHELTDRLLAQLKASKLAGGADDFSSNCARDLLSDWAIHAMERADRNDEIIPLCEAEARKTGSFNRLVKRLISAMRYEDAERWIQEGIRTTEKKWPGIASSLRNKLREIRTRQKNWPVVAVMQVEEFVRYPSLNTFMDCKKAASKVKAWTKMRKFLLVYLEKGELPWKQKGWTFPASGLDLPISDPHERFPRISDLIEIAIYEKNPDRVLHWYDQRSEGRFGWYGIDDDKIAMAVQRHAPDRAVAIWKNKAERMIAQVKPSAYREAATYLRKAAKVMNQQNKQAEWDRYLKSLREEHVRKRRLIEILDQLESKPIIKKH